MVFIGTMIAIVAAVMSNPVLLTQQNEQIIERIDALAKEREAEQQNQTHIILGNLSSELAKTKEDAHTNRLFLEALIKNQNITVVLEDNETGKISSSGIGGPIIIPHN